MVELGCWRLLPSMDSRCSNFEHIQHPEEMRRLLLKAVPSKLAHAAGAPYAEAVRVCLEKGRWEALEEWQSQELVREKVLRPLIELAKVGR